MDHQAPRHEVERPALERPNAGAPARMIAAVAEAATTLATETDLDRVADRIVEQVLSLGGKAAHVMFADQAAEKLRLVAHRGLNAELAERLSRVAFEGPLLASRAARSRKIEHVNLETVGDLALARAVIEQTGAQSLLAIPLLAFGELSGVLVWALSLPDPPTREEVYGLAAIAEVFAVGIANARSRAALGASEARFRLLAENARDLIFRYRMAPEPGFEYVSPSATKIVGYTPEEHYADPYLGQKVIHPDDVHKLDAINTGAWTADRPVEIRWIRKDGSMLWTEQHVNVLRDDQGQVVAIEGIARDITGRKAAEREREALLERLDAEKRWLEAVITNSPVGILLVSMKGGGFNVRANPRAKQMLGGLWVPGVSPDTLLRTPDGETLTADELLTRRILEGETVRSVEFVVKRADGVEVPIMGNAAPIEDGKGAVVGAVAVFEDVTALRELEKLREEWVSIIAHDLRQPLTSIMIRSDLLAHKCAASQPDVEREFEHLRAGARQMARLVGDLLDVSRLEAKQLELEPQSIDLNKWIGPVVERALALTKGIDVVVDTDEEFPAVLADPDRLEQVLANLLSNAAKYGRDGAPIQLRVHGAEHEIVFAVTNEGAGINPEEVPRLFLRFHRTVAGKKTAKGLGLGLYIVRGLVEAHGGRVWVESTPGEKTTFFFTLPAAG